MANRKTLSKINSNHSRSRMKRRRFLMSTVALALAAGAGALAWPRRWKYIVIHHSGGNYGTIDFLQEVHRQRQGGDPIDAIPYHYVIGNGNGLAMGEVASDWRQEFDIWGAHVSGNNSARNAFGIGICLIGNFEESAVPSGQLGALVTLTRDLMRRYGIRPENVGFHGRLAGENTLCPGRHFPVEEFTAAITL